MLDNKVVLSRLLLATFIGMFLGVERERSLKPAGVRTHMLVCLCACVISIISAYGFGGLGTSNDPARLIVGILQGIGFLGAGIIWRNQDGSVKGVTTAAEVFLLTSLGIGCGLGYYFLTFAATLITYATLTGSRFYAFLCLKLNRRKINHRSIICRKCKMCGGARDCAGQVD